MQAINSSSILDDSIKLKLAQVTQLVECTIEAGDVVSSNLTLGIEGSDGIGRHE